MPHHAGDREALEEEPLLSARASSDDLNNAEDGIRSPNDSKQTIHLGRGLTLMFAVFILVFLQGQFSQSVP